MLNFSVVVLFLPGYFNSLHELPRPLSSISLPFSNSPINCKLKLWIPGPFLVGLWQKIQPCGFVICLCNGLFVQSHPADCCPTSAIRASGLLFALRPAVFSLAKPSWQQQPWFSFRRGIFRNYMSRYIFGSRGLCSFVVSSVYFFVPSSKRSRGETGSAPQPTL